MELQVNGSGAAISVSDEVFGRELNETLVHQVVVAYMAAGRQGTSAQKTRSEVRGGGIKPWRQKGTGRARAGTSRSPIWRSGGATFASKTRSYDQKVNKKMYRGAMKVILSELVRSERLVVVDSLEVAEPRTKLLKAKLADLGVNSVTIVADEVTENLYLASRNLPFVDVLDVEGINPVSLIEREKLVVTSSALKKIEERFA
ncbi:MAG: 50S ribosomal protein L4 [Ectothiorhodospiraceae bacterium]|nr:50S ribosomal protein L4 [Ectothiorhodospiraceae bacterium]